jgi:hypothetical protein
MQISTNKSWMKRACHCSYCKAKRGKFFKRQMHKKFRRLSREFLRGRHETMPAVGAVWDD